VRLGSLSVRTKIKFAAATLSDARAETVRALVQSLNDKDFDEA